MCDEPSKMRRCETCELMRGISTNEAVSICNALPMVGAWQRWRAQIIKAIGYALKQHGICAYKLEIVDKISPACEFYSDGGV